MKYETSWWPFNESENPPYPELSLDLKHPNSSKIHKIKGKVDTGFSGVLGLPLRIIEELKLPNIGSTELKTATGVQQIPIYRILISNMEIQLPEVKSATIPTPRAIIGRGILANRIWLYDGKRKVYCFIED